MIGYQLKFGIGSKIMSNLSIEFKLALPSFPPNAYIIPSTSTTSWVDLQNYINVKIEHDNPEFDRIFIILREYGS